MKNVYKIFMVHYNNTISNQNALINIYTDSQSFFFIRFLKFRPKTIILWQPFEISDCLCPFESLMVHLVSYPFHLSRSNCPTLISRMGRLKIVWDVNVDCWIYPMNLWNTFSFPNLSVFMFQWVMKQFS